MQFDDSYFEGETREDFYIRPMMKRAWAAQLDVLHEIDRICKRHNIVYFADWGTLLGAVRHKGFIPWDDDLDIGMKREDYDRFMYYGPKELSGGMELINSYTESVYHQIMGRVVNGRGLNLSREYLDKYHGCPYMVGVDIFPQDYIPRDKQDETDQLELLKAANLLMQIWESENSSQEEKQSCLEELANLTGVPTNPEMPIQQQLCQLCDRICAMYSSDESDEMAQLCLLASDENYRLPKSCYAVMLDMPFENTTIPVPVGYDQILRLRYGEDYMTPVKHWNTHTYPFFKPQEEMLRELCKSVNKEMPRGFAE